MVCAMSIGLPLTTSTGFFFCFCVKDHPKGPRWLLSVPSIFLGPKHQSCAIPNAIQDLFPLGTPTQHTACSHVCLPHFGEPDMVWGV